MVSESVAHREAPNASSTGARISDGLCLEESAQLLVLLFPHAPPPKIRKEDNPRDVTEEVWTLLDEIDKNPQMLSASLILKLSKVAWFKDYFTNALLREASDSEDISVSDMVYLITRACPNEPPSSYVQRSFVERNDGKCVFFEPAKALDALAKSWDTGDGPSAEDKKMFLSLPWASAWFESTCVRRCSKQYNARLVTKDAKLTMIRIFHPCKPPTWQDEYPVRVGEDSVWTFRPMQWVNDVSNMWLGGAQRRVNLTQDEMRELEQLPWFHSLIEQKRMKRKSRVCRIDLDGQPNAKMIKTDCYDELMSYLQQSDDEDATCRLPVLDRSFCVDGADITNESQEV